MYDPQIKIFRVKCILVKEGGGGGGGGEQKGQPKRSREANTAV